MNNRQAKPPTGASNVRRDILAPMNRKIPRLLLLNALLMFIAALTISGAQQKKTEAPKTLRLYILDCGKITGVGEAAFGFQPGQLANTEMFTPCFLIAHPRGTMICVANASLFAGSTWIVQKIERDAMFAKPVPGVRGAPNPALYGELEKSKALLLNNEDHDVFGDGTVIIKFTPGHTPGHKSLFLKLARTGPVLLSGDLYHYPEELKLKVVPSFDFNKEQTAKSRAMVEEFVSRN